MAITLVRVDDRVIHGQIVTRWAREKNCDEIIAVDDKIASNKILAMVIKNATPPGIKSNIYTVENAIPKILEAKDSKRNYFLIVKTPTTLVKLIEKGCNFIKEVNFGPVSARPNTKTVGPNASLTNDEIDACEKLNQMGINITFQLVPDSKPHKWSDLRKNL